MYNRYFLFRINHIIMQKSIGLLDDILDFQKRFKKTQHVALLNVIAEEYEREFEDTIRVGEFVNKEMDKLTKAGFNMDAIFEYEKRLEYMRYNFEYFSNLCSEFMKNRKKNPYYVRNENFMYRVVAHAFRYECDKGCYPECEYEGFNDNHSVGYFINNMDYLEIIINCPEYLRNS